VADIVDMQVQPEGSGAGGDLHQRRRARRIERARCCRSARPDRIEGNQIGEIARADQRFADVGVPVAGKLNRGRPPSR
jgi:hypothetical protein